MKVLIACEFSGIVRDAFIERGHEAVSCDLLPSERPGPHIEGDVLELLSDTKGHWDLLIAHPPCTYLANSGVRWLYGGKGTERDPRRWQQMEDAARFFALLFRTSVPRVAIENPIMHSYGRELVMALAHSWGPEQIQTIQPVWLRGLPPLVPTSIVEGRTPRVHHASPGPDRWKERSRTFTGIAVAMADQWGALPPVI